MSDIPKAREILRSIIADECNGLVVDMAAYELRDKLQDALDLMGRHYVKTPAPRRRRALTEDQKIAVREHFRVHPLDPIDTVARRYDVANGRISEALRGQ